MIEEHDLALLIQDNILLLQQLAGRDCEVVFENQMGESNLSCNTSLLLQLLSGLVANATDAYGGKRGTIKIMLDVEEFEEEICRISQEARSGRYARIRVSDCGTGISPEALSRALAAAAGEIDTLSLYGQRLAVAVQVARHLDGFLTAETHPQKGTTISIYLPFDTTLRSKSGKSDTSAADAGQSKGSILLVQEGAGDGLAKMLAQLGYQVTRCGQGTALPQGEEGGFDLLLIDATLPLVEANELLAKVAGSGHETHSLVITNAKIDGIKADNILSEPFDLPALAAAITKSLGKSSSAV